MPPPKETYFSKKDDEEVFNTPQKKFIRHEVWGRYAKRRKEIGESPFIKYLTFPAEGCYDIRILEEMGLLGTIQIDGITKYENIAFCETDPEKFARIQEKLPGAYHHMGEYEELVGAYNAVLPEKAQTWFPFDVINLDFTSPLFYWRWSTNKERVTDAILRTFQIQKIRKTSFTLFLTLAARKPHDAPSGKIKLDAVLKDNLRDPRLKEFKNKFYEKYQIGRRGNIFDQMRYVDYLLISIPKIVIKMGNHENFDVICSKRFSYRGDHYDGTPRFSKMVTFVFECEFVGNPDGYSGKSPVEILYERYPKRILEYFTSSFTIINDFFESNDAIKQKFMRLLY